jgi:hypothetical protein
MKKLALLLVVLLAPAPASASIIDLEFTGVATFIFIPTLGSHPFVADFEFDTAQGTLIVPAGYDHELDGGLLAASLFVTDVGNLGTGLWPYNTFGRLFWDDGFSSVDVNVPGDGYHSVSLVDPQHESPFVGFWQFGTCPSTCAVLTSYTMAIAVDGVGVPAPVVGSGLPALVMAGLFGWWRWRQKIA